MATGMNKGKWMMMVIGLSFIICHLSFSSAAAQGIPDMKFRRLDTRDGLANSQVNSIVRDSHGYVWLATPFGLCRYDGYRVRNFYSYERDTMTLRSNRVDKVEEDHYGRLWLNHGMNYSVLDPVTEKVDRQPTRWLAEQGITGGLEYIHIDSKHCYWVKTYDNGFFHYDPRGKHLKRIPFGYEMGSFPKEFAITAATECREAMLFVSNMGELMCIDGNVGVVEWRDDYVKKQLNNFNDYWVFYDKPQDMIWVITHSKGTYIRERSGSQWYSNLTDYMRAKGFQNVPDDIVVWEACYDKKGLLWVATDHLGVLVLNFQTKEWKQFTNVKSDDSSLPESTAKHLYLDQLGRMWVTTFKCGVAMSSDALTNFVTLPVGDINAITEDHQGNWWLGLNSGGILKMDPKTYEVTDSVRKGRIGTPSDVIVSAYTARDGTLYFGTWEGGLITYKNGEWHCLTATSPGSKLGTNNVWSVTEDHWGNIWLGLLGGGVMRLDPKTGSQRVLTDKNSYLATVWTNSISKAANGWILAGNSEYCALIHPQTFKVINMPPPHDENSYTISRASTQALMDERNIIWQASPSGLSINDRTTGESFLLDMKSGFYGSNVVSMVEDDNHTMWVVTDHGVSNITPQKDEDGHWTFPVRSFNDRDGLQPGPFNQRAIYFTKSGLVLIGGQEGLDIINTRKLQAKKRKEKPLFCGLVIFNDLIEAGQKYNGRVILRQTLSSTDHIRLKDTENQFTIQMGSDDGGIKNGKRFVYRMEGFNDEWMKTSAISSDITYMGLPAGDYTLCVRMLNDDGTMGEEESRLDIIIGKPWYRTWWAFMVYIFIACCFGVWWLKKFYRGFKGQRGEADINHTTEYVHGLIHKIWG
ncbi:MAG: hypothetical protein K6D61_00085 [Prevotella sp.]|nr:hypothetical protein [Prevotella sp.]